MPVCSTQKQALHQMAVLPVPVSDCHVSCSAADGSSGGDSVGLLCPLQCTRWQFWWWQCRPAVHQMAVLVVTVSVCCVFCSASGRLSTGWQFCQCQCQHSMFSAVHLALLLVPSCHFWFSKRLVSDTSHRTVLLQCSLGFCAIKN